VLLVPEGVSVQFLYCYLFYLLFLDGLLYNHLLSTNGFSHVEHPFPLVVNLLITGFAEPLPTLEAGEEGDIILALLAVHCISFIYINKMNDYHESTEEYVDPDTYNDEHRACEVNLVHLNPVCQYTVCCIQLY
jgi:hypothetical protein